MSLSLNRGDGRNIRKFLKSLVMKMSFKDRFNAGIVTFGNRAEVQLTLTEGVKKRKVLNAVSIIR